MHSYMPTLYYKYLHAFIYTNPIYINAFTYTTIICKAMPRYTPHLQHSLLLSTWIMASSGSNGGHNPGHAGGQFGQSLTLNVGALTQAFAVDIQEATIPRNDS